MDKKQIDLTLDEIAVNKCLDGDDKAFGDIVERYWSRIYNRVHLLLKNHEDAEEITQDTFIRAQKGLENFRKEAAFSTWLYQIATNLAHNRYWYWFRRKKDYSMSLDEPLAEDSTSTAYDILPSSEDTPSEVIVKAEFVERINQAMQKLSKDHREVLVLRTQKELGYDEIAKELDLSVGTVKSRIARAREALKNLL